MINREKLFIEGSWVDPSSQESLDVLNPSTEEIIGRVTLANNEDVDRAVQAAYRALPEWSQTSVRTRAELLKAIANRLEERSDEFAALITKEVGAPIEFSNAVQIGWSIQYFRDAADALSEIRFEEPYGDGALIRRESVGVVGAITPWNFPLMQSAAKIAPALAAGSTVVLKPSEIAPLTLFAFAEIVMEVGLPVGVLNILTGFGPEAGEALVTHALVDAISFTGSTRAGTRIAALAAQDVKRVTLELGGKSAALVLPGADLENAVEATVTDCFLNSGQKCVAQTRLIVPRRLLPEVEELAVKKAESFAVGDPADSAHAIGPVVSDLQRERVRGHINRALESGARLLTGGSEPPVGREKGYFIQPTVFSGVTAEMPLAREEVFGPVLAILAYDTAEEAIAITNNSEYGLGGGVWASTREEGFDVARQIRTGQVSVNGAIPTPDLPFGGFKKSGIGREGGIHAINEFLEIKTIF